MRHAPVAAAPSVRGRPARTPSRRWRSAPALLALALALAAAGGGGCTGAKREPPPRPAPEVEVSRPLVKQVTDYEDFTGQTEAVLSVDVRARVTGYLEKANFKEGADVKQGDVLFEIDPRQYRAAAAKAQAVVAQNQALLKRLSADYERVLQLRGTQAVSPQEVDKAASDRLEAQATLEAARAELEVAELNLGYTTVQAPITGRVGSRSVDPGNLVKADDTVLTTIVSQDPVHVSFDVDERSLLRVRRLIRAGQMTSAREKEMTVGMELSDEEGFPHVGTIDFIDNRVDPGTGTLRVRAAFPNPQGLLSPGLFVRVRVAIGRPHRAVLVAEQALGTDQGQNFVYVVDDRNKVEYRKVKVGGLHDGLREIESGVSPEDRVVVRGLQRVRPKVEVKAKAVPMPTQDEGDAPTVLIQPPPAAGPAATPPPPTAPPATPADAPPAGGKGDADR